MAQLFKRIDFFKVTTTQGVDFVSVLQSSLLQKHWTRNNKAYELKYVESNPDYVYGIVVTTLVTGLPPSHLPSSDEFEEINLEEGAGIAYGNAFLYCPKTQILYYEANGNGCYHSVFKEFIRGITSGNDGFPHFDIDLDYVLTSDAYNKIYGFRYFQKIQIKVANPTSISAAHFNKKSPLYTIIKESSELNANKSAEIILEGDILTGGLKENPVKNGLEDLMYIGGLNNKNKVVIKGAKFEPDEDGHRIETVDLLAERLSDKIQLDEKIKDKDLQVHNRKSQIAAVFSRNIENLNKMFN